MKLLILLVAILSVSLANADPFEVGKAMPQVNKASTQYQGIHYCYGKVLSAYKFKSEGVVVMGLYSQDKGWFAYIIDGEINDVFIGDANYDGIIDAVQPIDGNLFLSGCIKLTEL